MAHESPPGQPMPIDGQALRAALDTAGFAVLHDLLPEPEVRGLETLVAPLFAGWDRIPAAIRRVHRPLDAIAEERHTREINWPPGMLPALRASAAVVRITALLETTFGAAAVAVMANALLKPAGVGTAIESHQDTAYDRGRIGRVVTAWIPFSDADERCGSVYYYHGSHRLGDLDHDRIDGGHSLRVRDLERLSGLASTAVEATRGSVAVHDSSTVHGSFPNLSEYDRLALSVRFLVR